MKTDDILNRCSWCTSDPLYINYHDKEWGVPLHDDQKLFELLTLEGAQAGLSWLTVLKKRDDYKLAFNDFNIELVSKYDETKLKQIQLNTGIIRNRLKIKSVVGNAKVILSIQNQFGSFNNYLWGYVRNQTITINNQKHPSSKAVKLATILSKDLKKRGMNFVGPTICYAFMQANGMINDHSRNCFRFDQLTQ